MQQNIEKCCIYIVSINKGYVRSYRNGLFKNCRRQGIFLKRKYYTIKSSSHVLPWLSCHDLTMILTSVPCIMISHDLDKGTIIDHDLARLTMILASVACLRSLGYQEFVSCSSIIIQNYWMFNGFPFIIHNPAHDLAYHESRLEILYLKTSAVIYHQYILENPIFVACPLISKIIENSGTFVNFCSVFWTGLMTHLKMNAHDISYVKVLPKICLVVK